MPISDCETAPEATTTTSDDSTSNPASVSSSDMPVPGPIAPINVPADDDTIPVSGCPLTPVPIITTYGLPPPPEYAEGTGPGPAPNTLSVSVQISPSELEPAEVQKNVRRNKSSFFELAPYQHEEAERYLAGLAKAFTLAIAYAANVGGVGTSTGTTPNIVMKGFADT